MDRSVYDDRPISVYDNMNSNQTVYGNNNVKEATTSNTIADRNGNNKMQQQQQQQHQHQHQHQQQQHYQQLLNNGRHNENLNESPQQHDQQHHQQYQHIANPLQSNNNKAYYATPLKLHTPANKTDETIIKAQLGSNSNNNLPTTTTTSTSTPIIETAIVNDILPTTTTPTSIAAAAAAAAAASSQSNGNFQLSVQKPFSQYSQTEHNETSQSIAAVKAALNDAKSKFFGINGYENDENFHNLNIDDSHNETLAAAAAAAAENYKLLQVNDDLNDAQSTLPSNFYHTTTKPIPPPKPKPKPKYQNIPENSAIFRQEEQLKRQPPVPPPKPAKRTQLNSGGGATTPISTNIGAGVALLEPKVMDEQQQLYVNHKKQQQREDEHTNPTAIMAQNARTTYTPIAFNDIETPQPSQAVYMATTVPQNIKGSKIAGRHTPTRNSLRHSRMLVVNNKNYQGPQICNAMQLKRPNLTRLLFIIEILIGFLITFLSTWIFFLSPSANVEDNPYWSGLILIFSGCLGLGLVRYQRIKRHKLRENFFIFLRSIFYLLSMVATLFCCLALVYALLHFLKLIAHDTECISTNPLLEHGSCTCIFNSNLHIHEPESSFLERSHVGHDVNETMLTNKSYKLAYRDLSCSEVTGEWSFILCLSFVLNSVGLFLMLVILLLIICDRKAPSKRQYSSVNTNTF